MICIKRYFINCLQARYINYIRDRIYRFNLFRYNGFYIIICDINLSINMCNFYTFSFRTLLFNRLTCKCNLNVSIFTPAIIQSLQFTRFILYK